MLNWFSKESKNHLSSIVQHTEGVAFACVTDRNTQKPLLSHCFFQPQISDHKTTLKQLLEQTNISKKYPLSTLLDSNNFLLLLMQRPDVSEDELVDTIRWQIKDQLDYPATEAIIEIIDIPGQQERGRLPMIYAIAAHQEILKSSINVFDENKLNLQYIDIPELAQRNVSSLLPEDRIGVALLNLQPNYSLLTITHEGELYLSRVIDIGYENLEQHDEPVTETTGFSLEQSSSGLETNISKIVLEIQRSLDYYESHYGKPSIGNLVIAPLENEIPDLNNQLKEELGLAVRSLELDEIIEIDSDLNIELQAKCFGAIGAALRNSAPNSTLSKSD